MSEKAQNNYDELGARAGDVTFAASQSLDLLKKKTAKDIKVAVDILEKVQNPQKLEEEANKIVGKLADDAAELRKMTEANAKVVSDRLNTTNKTVNIVSTDAEEARKLHRIVSAGERAVLRVEKDINSTKRAIAEIRAMKTIAEGVTYKGVDVHEQRAKDDAVITSQLLRDGEAKFEKTMPALIRQKRERMTFLTESKKEAENYAVGAEEPAAETALVETGKPSLEDIASGRAPDPNASPYEDDEEDDDEDEEEEGEEDTESEDTLPNGVTVPANGVVPVSAAAQTVPIDTSANTRVVDDAVRSKIVALAKAKGFMPVPVKGKP